MRGMERVGDRARGHVFSQGDPQCNNRQGMHPHHMLCGRIVGHAVQWGWEGPFRGSSTHATFTIRVRIKVRVRVRVRVKVRARLVSRGDHLVVPRFRNLTPSPKNNQNDTP